MMLQSLSATASPAWSAPGALRPGIADLLSRLVAAVVAGARRAVARLEMARAAGATGGAHARPLPAAEAERFRRLILPHLDAAYNLARFLSRDADAAEDIVQDAFLRALGGFAGFRGGDPRAWILAIVRNCYRNRRAGPPGAAGPVRPPEDGEDGFEAPETWVPDDETPESLLLRRDEAATVRAVLDALPEPFREVMVLRELADLSYREIAEITAVPIGTVMSRLARARDLFRNAWRCRVRAPDTR